MSETGTICKHYKNCRYYQVSALKNLEKTSFALPLIVSQGNFSADRAKCGIKQKAENHDLKKLNKLPLVDASCINIPHFVRPARSYASLTAGLVCLHLSADADVRIIKNGIQKVYLSRLSLRNIKQQTSFFLDFSFVYQSVVYKTITIHNTYYATNIYNGKRALSCFRNIAQLFEKTMFFLFFIKKNTGNGINLRFPVVFLFCVEHFFCKIF